MDLGQVLPYLSAPFAIACFLPFELSVCYPNRGLSAKEQYSDGRRVCPHKNIRPLPGAERGRMIIRKGTDGLLEVEFQPDLRHARIASRSWFLYHGKL
jgi:hypothetical protein